MDDKTDYFDTQATISVQRLPVEDMVQFANGLTESDVVDFGSGDKLKLVFNLGSGQGSESRIRSKISSIMEENGIEIADDSDFVMELRYSVGKPQTETYRIIGDIGGPRTRTETFTPTSCSAKLTYKGSRIWSAGDSAGLGGIHSEDQLDQTLSKKVSVNRLLEFKYPNNVRVLDPKLQRKYRWQ